MCEFRKIILDETGYVAQCPLCQSVQVVYGTSVVHICPMDWISFRAYLHDICHDHRIPENKSLKNIMLNFGGEGPLQMFLTANELQKFFSLVDKADSEISARQMMKLLTAKNK